jgi:transmembrane sensor
MALPTPDWQQLDRFLAGEASPAEADVVRAWIAENPRRAALLRLPSVVEPAVEWNVDVAWSKVRSVPRPKPRWETRAVRWLAAASVLVIAGSGLIWRLARRPDAPRPVAVAMRDIVADNGKRTTTKLDDGTTVTLNAGSRLSVPVSFGAGARDVQLDGEALFEVRHDPARSFRVHAGGSVAEDLGTRFVVRAYADLGRVEVAVSEGVVSLRADSSAARHASIISAGQIGRLEPAHSPVVTTIANPDRYFAWVRGTLVFDATPLADALPELSRWYDVEIRVFDAELRSRPFTGRFRDESLSDVLDALSLALSARYERGGRVITFSKALP